MRIKRAVARCLLLSAWATSLAGVATYAAEAAFDLRIENGRLPQNMRVVRVKQGDTVTLRWTADRPITVHLHGYDIEKRIEPGQVGEMSFTARATGRYPVHAHDARTGPDKGADEEAPLLYVEVYPK